MKKTDDIVAGIHAVTEAMDSGKEISKLFIQKGERNEKVSELIKIATRSGTPYSFVPKEKLDRLTSQNHQGVVALLSAIEFITVENLVQSVFESGEVPFFIILDRITDVRNFGAIIRSAVCFNAHGIIVPFDETARVGSDTVQTSSGAVHKIKFCRSRNLTHTLRYLKESGLTVFSTTEHEGKNIFTADFNQPIAIILGSEDEGVSATLLKSSDEVLKIPTSGAMHSLNVSVAAGIICYEVGKQRILLNG